MNKKIIRTVLAAAMAVSMMTTAFATSGYDLTKVDKVTGTAVTEIATEAVEKAAKDNSVAKVELMNANEVTADAFEKIAEVAKNANVKAEVVNNVVVNNEVVLQVAVDAINAAKTKTSVNMGGEINYKSTIDLFNKYFSNKIAVVKLDQVYSYNQAAKIAVKIDLSKLNKDNLYFYSYNSKTNSYVRVTTDYVIDANGYVHFSTVRADSIIITDAPLTAK